MGHPEHSPQSSAGVGPSSSPYAGTDPTMYSPELVRNNHPGHHRHNNSEVTIVGKSKQPVRNDSASSEQYTHGLPLPPRYVQGAFSNEVDENDLNYVSRYVFVAQVPNGVDAGRDAEHELYAVQHQMKLYACFANTVLVYNHGVYLRFDDLHETHEAKEILEQHGFTIDFVSSYDYAIAKSQDTGHLNEFDGQIKLSILMETNPDHAFWEFSDKDLAGLQTGVERIARAFGRFRNCVHIETIDDKLLLVFRIEFWSVDAANRAVSSLRTDPVWGMTHHNNFQWCTVEPTHFIGEPAQHSPHRTKPRVDEQGRFVGYRPAPVWPNNGNYRHPHDQHNRVRRERIQDGSDVRTTIMLRNIPNKMDWLTLKALLDEVCFGTFDFMYLRIDFKSACNVGYAFINFADVRGMVSLIDRIERRPWVGFRSSKASEISYATIQGREALVQKFRNSSVMQETPFCRPRLFFTYIDAQVMNQLRDASTEHAFPRPDNLSKLQRSMDSARAIGLYPPQGHSDGTERRKRTSAYDRGTPRDMEQTEQAALHYARQHAGPMNLSSLNADMKEQVENWYSYNFTDGNHVSFDFIPFGLIAQYFVDHPDPPQFPGILGGRSNPPYAGDLGIASDNPRARYSFKIPSFCGPRPAQGTSGHVDNRYT